MRSLDLGEKHGEVLVIARALPRPVYSDRHDRSHMRTLTYPVGRELSAFTRTKQLVIALRAARPIEGRVFLFVTLK